MFRLNGCRAFQVPHRPRHFQNPVMCPRREALLSHGTFEQAFTIWRKVTECADVARRHLRVGIDSGGDFRARRHPGGRPYENGYMGEWDIVSAVSQCGVDAQNRLSDSTQGWEGERQSNFLSTAFLTLSCSALDASLRSHPVTSNPAISIASRISIKNATVCGLRTCRSRACPSREATACDSPARQCRVSRENDPSPAGTGQFSYREPRHARSRTVGNSAETIH